MREDRGGTARAFVQHNRSDRSQPSGSVMEPSMTVGYDARKRKRLGHMNDTPTPLTDLRRRVAPARALIRDVLTELVGPVDMQYDFYREWNGCWKVKVDLRQPVRGQIDFTLLDTPGGGMLALPRPLPERWRVETGIGASDGTRWSLDSTGALVRFPFDTTAFGG